MKPTIQLVIFDCDGVLVDSEWIGVRVDEEIFAEVGIAMSRDEVITRFVGRPAAAMLAAVEEHLGHPVSADDVARYDRLYFDAIEHELAPVDGIEEALAEIAWPVCVASSSEPASLRRKLEIAGLLDRFDPHVFSAAEVRHGKPAPDLFLHVAARMGADPSRCVVVEDSRPGVQAARAAGMDVFAYAAGITPVEDLSGHGTIIFKDMGQLPELLERWAVEPCTTS